MRVLGRKPGTPGRERRLLGPPGSQGYPEDWLAGERKQYTAVNITAAVPWGRRGEKPKSQHLPGDQSTTSSALSFSAPVPGRDRVRSVDTEVLTL